MRTLLVGGTGLIGRALASNLIAAGHQVWILSRHPENAPIPQGANAAKWDGYSPAGWEKLLEDMDAIVNLAGENIGSGRWSPERKENILTSRVNAGKAIADALRASKTATGRTPQVLVQSSAIGYYGPVDDHICNETTPPGRDFLSKICVEWEDTTRPTEEMGIRRIIIRTGLVLSLAGGALPRTLLPFKLFVGGPIGSGRQWYSWIHIQDEVEAIRYLIENDTARGVYNLTAPNPLSNADFGRSISRVLTKPYWIPAPAFVLRLALGEMSTLALDGQRVVPQRLVEAGYPFHFVQAEDALRDLIGK